MSETDKKVEELRKDIESLEKDMEKIRERHNQIHDEYKDKMRELMLILFGEWKEKRTDNLFASQD